MRIAQMRLRFGSTIGTLRSAERSIRQYAKSCAAQRYRVGTKEK